MGRVDVAIEIPAIMKELNAPEDFPADREWLELDLVD